MFAQNSPHFPWKCCRFFSESFADTTSQRYRSANTTQLLQIQFHLLHSADIIKVFTATTKGEIKPYNLNHGSEIRGVLQNKLCSLLLQLKFSSLKKTMLTYLILVPKIMYFFFLEEMDTILKMWPVKENK